MCDIKISAVHVWFCHKARM